MKMGVRDIWIRPRKHKSYKIIFIFSGIVNKDVSLALFLLSLEEAVLHNGTSIFCKLKFRDFIGQNLYLFASLIVSLRDCYKRKKKPFYQTLSVI